MPISTSVPLYPGSFILFILTVFNICFNIGAIINYRVAICVCLPVHLLAIHIVYIGYNSFKNVGTVSANGCIMRCLRSSCL